MRRSRRTSNRYGRIQKPPHLGHLVRSKFEKEIAEQLKALGVDYGYESQSIPYRIIQNSRYTPDFILPNGIMVEAKGMLTAKDRKKHLLIRDQHPEYDIRFVFQQPGARIYKGSKTRVRDWCDRNGFIWAAKRIPEEWIKE